MHAVEAPAVVVLVVELAVWALDAVAVCVGQETVLAVAHVGGGLVAEGV